MHCSRLLRVSLDASALPRFQQIVLVLNKSAVGTEIEQFKQHLAAEQRSSSSLARELLLQRELDERAQARGDTLSRRGAHSASITDGPWPHSFGSDRHSSTGHCHSFG